MVATDGFISFVEVSMVICTVQALHVSYRLLFCLRSVGFLSLAVDRGIFGTGSVTS